MACNRGEQPIDTVRVTGGRTPLNRDSSLPLTLMERATTAADAPCRLLTSPVPHRNQAFRNACKQSPGLREADTLTWQGPLDPPDLQDAKAQWQELA